MKKALLFLLLGFVVKASTAQVLNPVHWTWNAEPTKKGEYKLTFSAMIDKGWHTYSMFIGEGGPVATSLAFDKANKDFQLLGKAEEGGGKIHEGHDPVFDMQLKYFENGMIITQLVKITKDTKLKGTLEYMSCDDSRCLPPDDLEFSFDLKLGSGVKINWDTTKPQNSIPPTNKTGNTNALIPGGAEKKAFDSLIQASITQSLQKDSLKAIATAKIDGKFGAPVLECGTDLSTQKKSLLAIILLGFLGGLVALVTPCVFPMIPLTVSFFTKRSESKSKGQRDAFFYAFSIVFIYFLIALPFLFFQISPDTLNEISTGATLNIFFFLIFVVFAFSFFGFYEITLPSFIANKADSASNVGGLVGIFFMALTLAIVSFSCTGPILGSLLVGALSSPGGKVSLVAGMTSFGFALALPFGLFAMFPNMMKSLPKSGGWLNSVKVVFVFFVLKFAIKII
jgi:thiol:disulfide interchange protein